MASLSILTVKQLEALAKKHGIKLSGKKADKIKQIKSSGIDKGVIEDYISIHLKSKKEPKRAPIKAKEKVPKKVPKKKTASVKNLEDRISLLEKQVKFLMGKIGNLEVTTKNSTKKISANENIIKNKIISAVSRGNSITIDDLLKDFSRVSFDVIERVVNDLIDDEIFDGSEGKSNKKIDGRIGRLIRR